jgi:hypothetical protein
MKTRIFRGRFSNKWRADERGQALVIVLIVMLLAGLIIPPLLNFMTTGVKTGEVFEAKTDEMLAADAGISDGMYQVKYDYLAAMFPGPTNPYYPYDFNTTWNYSLPQNVNDNPVSVTVQNIWIPCDSSGLAIDPKPSKAQAKYVIEGVPAAPPDPKKDPKLIVAGSLNPTSTATNHYYDIKLIYNYAAPENLHVTSLGVWLPYGFHLKANSAYNNLNAPYSYCPAPAVVPYDGGEAVVWTFNNYPFKGSTSPVKKPFPGYSASGSTLTSTVTFEYTIDSAMPEGSVPAAVAWINTDIDLTQMGLGCNYAWDGDMRIYHVTSTAGDASVEAYTAQNKPRELEGTIPGDYRAVGNSLMLDDHPGSPPIRDTLLSSSSATVSDIPNDAIVKQARLYWSGWVNNGPDVFSDACENMSNWGTPGNLWKPYNGSGNKYFYAHGSSGSTEAQQTLSTLPNKLINLSAYAGQEVTLSWDQWEGGTLESGDGLDFAISKDGEAHWSAWMTAFRDDNPASTFTYIIPEDYLTSQFALKFRVVSCIDGSGGNEERVYIDNIKVSTGASVADLNVTFQVNSQSVNVTASRFYTLYNDPGYSYSCFLDVTNLVKQYTTNQTGNGAYTVGGVNAATGNEWSYAGWSLVIIYTSADTKGNQLYIFDEFVYSDVNTTIVFPVSGFLVPQPVAGETNAARLTCFVGEGDVEYTGDRLHFIGQSGAAAYLPDLTGTNNTTNVWNSQSVGMSKSGVDIDTFYVPWGSPLSSGLLRPDDTKATIELPTQTDSWNLVYVIVAFRSKTDTGGVLSYLVLG